VAASSVVAYTQTNFSGQLTVNPTTGVIYITNAKQAGTYTVTVKAFGAGTVTKTFTLTVTNPLCSQGNLGDSSMMTVNTEGVHNPLAIADLNNDGKQDLVTSDGAVKLGDGKGGFTDGTGFVISGTSKNSIAIGDLNGDGIVDLVFLERTEPIEKSSKAPSLDDTQLFIALSPSCFSVELSKLTLCLSSL